MSIVSSISWLIIIASYNIIQLNGSFDVKMNLGIVTQEIDPVSVRVANWKHLLMIKVPCYQDMIDDDTLESIRLLPSWVNRTYSHINKMLSDLNTYNLTGSDFDKDLIEQQVTEVKTLTGMLIDISESTLLSYLRTNNSVKNLETLSGVTYCSQYIREHVVANTTTISNLLFQGIRAKRSIKYSQSFHFINSSQNTFNFYNHPDKSNCQNSPNIELCKVPISTSTPNLGNDIVRITPPKPTVSTTSPSPKPDPSTTSTYTFQSNPEDYTDEDIKRILDQAEGEAQRIFGRVYRAASHKQQSSYSEEQFYIDVMGYILSHPYTIHYMRQRLISILPPQLSININHANPSTIKNLAKCAIFRSYKKHITTNLCGTILRSVIRSGKDPIYNHRRYKRALLPFVGEIQKFLIGVGTEKDTIHLQKQLDFLHLQYKNLSDVFLSQENLTTSAMTITNDQIKSLSYSVNVNAKHMMEDLRSIVTVQNQIRSKLETQTKITAISIYLQNLNLVTRRVSTTLQAAQYSLDRIQNIYSELSNTYITHHVNVNTIPVSTLINTVREIRSRLDPLGFTLGSHDLTDYYFYNITSLSLSNNSIVLTMDFPITARQTTLKFYQIISTPIYEANHWLKLFSGYEKIIVIDPQQQLWNEISPTTYNACKNSFGKVCTLLSYWERISITDCLPKLALDDNLYTENCKLELFKDINNRNEFVVKLKQNSWFISSSINSSSATVRCKDSSGSKIISTNQLIEKRSTVTLPDNCSLHMNHLILIPDTPTVFNSESFINTYVPTQKVHVDNIEIKGFNDVKVQRLSEISLHDMVDIEKLTGRVLDDGISVKTLLSSKRDKLELFKSSSDILEAKWRELPKVEESTSSLWSYISGLFTNVRNVVTVIIIVVPVILVLCCLCGLIAKCNKGMKHARRVGSTIALANLPLTHSAPILTTKLPMSDPPQIQTFEELFNMISSKLQHMAIMSFIATIIVMCLYHCLLKRYINMTLEKMWGNQISPPINKAKIMIHGEMKIRLFVSVAITSFFSHTPFIGEVSFYASSLPGSPNDWTATKTSKQIKFISNGHFSRFQSRIKFNVNWGRICLRHRSYTNLDSCEELSGKVDISASRALIPLRCSLPYFWYKGEVLDVIRVVVESPYDFKVLYSYDQQAIAQNSPSHSSVNSRTNLIS